MEENEPVNTLVGLIEVSDIDSGNPCQDCLIAYDDGMSIIKMHFYKQR